MIKRLAIVLFLLPTPAIGQSDTGPPFETSGWSSRTRVTVQASEVAENLTNFPVYVDLSRMSAGFHAAVAADCGDIRVTRVSTGLELPRVIDSCDTLADTG